MQVKKFSIKKAMKNEQRKSIIDELVEETENEISSVTKTKNNDTSFECALDENMQSVGADVPIRPLHQKADGRTEKPKGVRLEKSITIKRQQNQLKTNTPPTTESSSTTPTTRKKQSNRLYDHPHEKHRQRVKKAADLDPDLETFSDVEVLEYILFNTISRIDTNLLAHKLIENFGSFSGVLNAQVTELKNIKGVSEETARNLSSIIAVARVAEKSRLKSNAIINNTIDAVQYLTPFFTNRATEMVYLLCLNNNNRVVGKELVSKGDTNFAFVDTKVVGMAALRHDATKVILAHNHPSGTLEPSNEDRQMTAQIMLALMGMHIPLIDHIIFTPNDYYSFYQNRELEEIYGHLDKTHGTKIIKEMRLKIDNYRKGIYILEK